MKTVAIGKVSLVPHPHHWTSAEVTWEIFANGNWSVFKKISKLKIIFAMVTKGTVGFQRSGIKDMASSRQHHIVHTLEWYYTSWLQTFSSFNIISLNFSGTGEILHHVHLQWNSLVKHVSDLNSQIINFHNIINYYNVHSTHTLINRNILLILYLRYVPK